MLSKLPIDLEKIDDESMDNEILRAGIIAELDAINLYEQMAAKAKNPLIKRVMLAVAKEEKEHVGEFESLLMELDNEQKEEYEEGKNEVQQMK